MPAAWTFSFTETFSKDVFDEFKQGPYAQTTDLESVVHKTVAELHSDLSKCPVGINMIGNNIVLGDASFEVLLWRENARLRKLHVTSRSFS